MAARKTPSSRRTVPADRLRAFSYRRQVSRVTSATYRPCQNSTRLFTAEAMRHGAAVSVPCSRAYTHSYHRPKLEVEEFSVPELVNELSGTAVEIMIPS